MSLRFASGRRSNLAIFVLLLTVAFVTPISAFAATTAGVTPGSFWYFFDTASEKIALFFTFNPESKAKKALEYADERLAEVEAIVDEKNPDAVKAAIADYEGNVALATEKSKEVKDKGQAESLLNSIENSASRNQEVLSAVLIKVPEEAKAAIAQAIEASKRGQEEAVRQIVELKGEVEQLKQEVAELKQDEDVGQPSEVEKLKKEVEELKTRDEEREKAIEELSKRKPEGALAPVKTPDPRTSAVTSIPKPATTAIRAAKTFATPSGAIIDDAGNIISPPIKIPIPDVSVPNAGSRVLTSEEIYSLVSPSVILISASGGNGSGFVINEGKYTLTNAHVVGDDQVVQLKLQSGVTFNGVVLGKNVARDLALIFNGDQRPPAITFGSSGINSLRIGADVFALGFPLSFELNAVTFTKGTLSARQNVAGYPDILLQMDAAINHGNSGGPLVNNKGEVVGMNTFGRSDAQGIYFAIPIQYVIELIPSLSQYGRSRVEVYPIGSTLNIKRGMTVQIGYNDALSCDELGFKDADLALCNIYRNYNKDYKWNILEDVPR